MLKISVSILLAFISFPISVNAQTDSTIGFQVGTAIGFTWYHFPGIVNDQSRFNESVQYPQEDVLSGELGKNLEPTFLLQAKIPEGLFIGISLSLLRTSTTQMADTTSSAGAHARFEFKYSIREISPRFSMRFTPPIQLIKNLNLELSGEIGPGFTSVTKDLWAYTAPYAILTNDPSSLSDLLNNQVQGLYQCTTLETRLSLMLTYKVFRTFDISFFAAFEKSFSRSIAGEYSVFGNRSAQSDNYLLKSYFGNLSLEHNGSVFGLAVTFPILF